jgi:hypothetical protein
MARIASCLVTWGPGHAVELDSYRARTRNQAPERKEGKWDCERTEESMPERPCPS